MVWVPLGSKLSGDKKSFLALLIPFSKFTQGHIAWPQKVGGHDIRNSMTLIRYPKTSCQRGLEFSRSDSGM